MEQFEHIDVTKAHRLAKQNKAQIVDIRDKQSFTLGHASGALHLTNETMVTLLAQVAFEQPLLVMCYHGISSQGAAQYLINQGFEQVYSVDGGFAAWQRAELPTQSYLG